MKNKSNQKKVLFILLLAVVLIIFLATVSVVQISKSGSETQEPKYITVKNNVNVISGDEIDISAILNVIQANNNDFDKESVKTACHKTTDQNDYTIDIFEMYDNIETSSCYTAFVENGVLTRIADNHYPNFRKSKKLINSQKLSKEDVEKILKKQRAKVKKIGAVKISNQECRYYYDCGKNTLKFIVLTEYIADDETVNVLEYEKKL